MGWRATALGQLGDPVLTRPPPSAGPAVEAAVCRAVLAPLRPALWTRLRTLRAQELRRLRRRQIALRAGAGPPGARGAGTEGRGPAPGLRSRIHARLEHLHAACAPRRKVALLLAVCSDVYEGLGGSENQGKGQVAWPEGWRSPRGLGDLRPQPQAPVLRLCPEPLGADAFLPALTEELIWSPHIGETQLDVEFLMELLDPDELRGEGEREPPEGQDLTWGRPRELLTASACPGGKVDREAEGLR